MAENKDLIVIKQLPVIEQYLENLSLEIDEQVKNALSLQCDEETVKEVKVVRADLSNKFKDLENKRKEVKKAVLEPYDAFEEIYKRCVTDKFKFADTELKTKIDNVEDSLKNEKRLEVVDYFKEYATSKNLNWLVEDKYYTLADINITLSASKKSLKEKVNSFVDKVVDDMSLISTQEQRDEIFVEYQKDLNVTRSIKEVQERKIELEKVKSLNAEVEKKEISDQEVIQKIDEVLKAPEVEEIYIFTFKVTGTKEELQRLVKILDDGGFKYEQQASTN